MENVYEITVSKVIKVKQKHIIEVNKELDLNNEETLNLLKSNLSDISGSVISENDVDVSFEFVETDEEPDTYYTQKKQTEGLLNKEKERIKYYETNNEDTYRFEKNCYLDPFLSYRFAPVGTIVSFVISIVK